MFVSFVVGRNQLAIVYLFNVLPWSTDICKKGLPKYIQHTLEQSLLTQPDAETFILSNFADWDCNNSARSPSSLKGVTFVDYSKFMTTRTKKARANAMALAESKDDSGLDWTTTLLRFLIIEDFMVRNEAIGFYASPIYLDILFLFSLRPQRMSLNSSSSNRTIC